MKRYITESLEIFTIKETLDGVLRESYLGWEGLWYKVDLDELTPVGEEQSKELDLVWRLEYRNE